MSDSGRDIREDYDVTEQGDFRTIEEFEKAKENGDIDSHGYDRNSNHYKGNGIRDYDSGKDQKENQTSDSDK